MLYAALLRTFARWFAMSLAAWVAKQLFDAVVSPWFAPTLAHMRSRSEVIHAWFKDLASKITSLWKTTSEVAPA